MEKKDMEFLSGHWHRRAIFELWKTGFSVREILPRSTFYKYRSSFLDSHKIDIDIPPTV